MNIQLNNTEEYIDRKQTGTLGQVLIRCNNVLWVSAAKGVEMNGAAGDVKMEGWARRTRKDVVNNSRKSAVCGARLDMSHFLVLCSLPALQCFYTTFWRNSSKSTCETCIARILCSCKRMRGLLFYMRTINDHQNHRLDKWQTRGLRKEMHFEWSYSSSKECWHKQVALVNMRSKKSMIRKYRSTRLGKSISLGRVDGAGHKWSSKWSLNDHRTVQNPWMCTVYNAFSSPFPTTRRFTAPLARSPNFLYQRNLNLRLHSVIAGQKLREHRQILSGMSAEPQKTHT